MSDFSSVEPYVEEVTYWDPTAGGPGENPGSGDWVTVGVYSPQNSVGATGPGPMTAAKAAALIQKEIG